MANSIINVIMTLDENKIKALVTLHEITGGNFQIGGSLSLLGYKIINREIHDLDIIVQSPEYITPLLPKNVPHTECYDYFDDSGYLIENPPVTRIFIRLCETPICIFFSKEEEYTKCEFEGCALEFKISHPKYAIEAKKNYVKKLLNDSFLSTFEVQRLEKHMSDILAYYKNPPSCKKNI